MADDKNAAPETQSSNDPVFATEQAHLSVTYQTLVSMEERLLQRMRETAESAEEYKRASADEVASNFASEGEAQETYVEYANMNSVIDAYNQLQQADAGKLSNIMLLKPQPYFAKVVLQYKPGADPKEIYIGNAGISDDTYHRLVVDWRSPVAEVYYNQSNGPTSYEANGRTIKVDMKLRRQFDIADDTLKAYFDTTVAIQDELLLASLSRQRSSHMHAITTTIQKEQNLIIRHEDVPALLVNGIAGSGKTSVLLQRIAYLFYQQRESLDPNNVYLITPNPVFRNYIDNVLPDMGERNPHILTWDEFTGRLVPEGRTFNSFHTSMDVLERIDHAVETLSFTDKDFRDIKYQGVTLITAQQINRIAARYKNVPAGPRLVTLMREELENRLESRLGQMAGTEQFQDEVNALSYNQQLTLFGEPALMDTDEQAKAYTLQYLKLRFGQAIETIQLDHWIRVDRIAKRIVGIDDLSFLEWLYLKIACTGLGNEDARFVMIDEVQDYSPAQLAVLARYYKYAHFLLLGDENQAITEHASSFNEVKAVFEQHRGDVSECHLLTSYRSTPAITELFATLASGENAMRISSVQRDDTKPEFITYPDDAACRSELTRILSDLSTADGITAVIAHDDKEARDLWGTLNDIVSNDQLTYVAQGSTLPDHGVVLITLKLAKGLEFDHVIIPNANEGHYPATPLAQHQLYTAISRATKTISLLAKEEFTPLLKKAIS
ncbi:MAG: AAA family ATPase [Eggerthellaceae bacterium]